MSIESNFWVTGWPGPPTPPLDRERESIIQEHWLLSCSTCTTAVKLLKKRTGLEPDGSASIAFAMKALTPQHPWVIAHICKASVRETEIGRTPGAC